jgi:hypothetical protein
MTKTARPSPPELDRTQRRLGPPFHSPTSAKTDTNQCTPSIGDRRSSVSLSATKPPCDQFPANPSAFLPSPTSVSTKTSESKSGGWRAGRPTKERRRRVTARRLAILTRGWACRHWAITRWCPKMGAAVLGVPFPDSDEVESGNGGPRWD